MLSKVIDFCQVRVKSPHKFSTLIDYQLLTINKNKEN